MGIDIISARFLIGEARRGVNLTHTLTLGRQEIYINKYSYGKILKILSNDGGKSKYADIFFKLIGVKKLDVMDASDYEGATIIHDLNQPLPIDYVYKWDSVIDGGTLEHVFNFPQAIKTCMELVRCGGNLILLTPWHNYSGHGFYQFSPELFYRILSPENGFLVERMLINQKGQWFSIKDPELIKSRVEFYGDDSTMLYISAKRFEIKKIFTQWPQQSDYSHAWQESTKSNANKISYKDTSKAWLLEKIPAFFLVQESWRKIKKHYSYKKYKSKWCETIEEKNGIPI
jgi:hypothetical protein